MALALASRLPGAFVIQRRYMLAVDVALMLKERWANASRGNSAEAFDPCYRFGLGRQLPARASELVSLLRLPAQSISRSCRSGKRCRAGKLRRTGSGGGAPCSG
jgi:hypothetical protein